MPKLSPANETPARPHTLSMENRSNLMLQGISAVGAFDEKQVVLTTQDGAKLTITGESLHMTALSLEEGKVALTGRIDALQYSARSLRAGKGWRDLFK